MTLNPTAVAPNPRYRGAKPRERETQERELEIETDEARAEERRLWRDKYDRYNHALTNYLFYFIAFRNFVKQTMQNKKKDRLNSILSESVKDDEENQMIALRAMEAEDDEEIIDSNDGSIIFSSGVKRDGGGDEGGGDEQFLQINRLQQHASSEKSFNRWASRIVIGDRSRRILSTSRRSSVKRASRVHGKYFGIPNGLEGDDGSTRRVYPDGTPYAYDTDQQTKQNTAKINPSLSTIRGEVKFSISILRLLKFNTLPKRVLEIDLSYESLSYVKVAYTIVKHKYTYLHNKNQVDLEIMNLSLNFSPVISISSIRVTVEWYCKMSWGES
ncbi:hypothetical protein G5I_09360 [Acromyrmex echinatior]|uniref:Uncharacterized protein n=1 Tax=Acromyrmex echinatior TaxID=103372 RepID=F4WU07_ACREC|nr:hypothetical protein G5I_09360 [Acromyrmex echinatior]